jgi:hypothetical protein
MPIACLHERLFIPHGGGPNEGRPRQLIEVLKVEKSIDLLKKSERSRQRQCNEGINNKLRTKFKLSYQMKKKERKK